MLERELSDFDRGNEATAPETAPSPFLEGTKIQYAWDSTSLGALKKCFRFYELEIIEGWTKPNGNVHLRWGQEYHSAIEDFEKAKANGADYEEAVHIAVRNLLQRIAPWDPDPHTDGERLKSKAHLLRSVVWYFEKFKDDPAKTVRLKNGEAAVEVSFQIELPFHPEEEIRGKWDEEGHYFPKRSPVQQYLLCGHLDRIVDYGGDLFVMDHKSTTTTIGQHYFSNYDPDNQMTLYSLAGKMLMSSPIRGVIIDAVQVAAGFSRFSRGFTYRTEDQCDEWLGEAQRWMGLAEQCATEGHWPMNDTACGMYGGCKFREVCSRSPHVRQKWLEASFERREQWNPLKAR